MLSQLFRGVNPNETVSRLRHAIAGKTGPHTARNILITVNKAKKAGYTPESLLTELGLDHRVYNA
ncbi:MAG: hypothetical protein ABI548_03950 [Polyangiaceae bacterium]